LIIAAFVGGSVPIVSGLEFSERTRRRRKILPKCLFLQTDYIRCAIEIRVVRVVFAVDAFGINRSRYAEIKSEFAVVRAVRDVAAKSF
jgi:hypothetical protein